MEENYLELLNILGDSKVKINEPMSKHTTLKIGGKADILVIVDDIQDIILTLKYAKDKNIPVTLIGNGSKLLVLDNGVRGIVLKIGPMFNGIKVQDNVITAMAGATLPYLAGIARKNSLSGLEFACGIPGALGGAIFQNAGAYGSEMANIIDEVTYLDEDLNVHTAKVSELEFGYRTSMFKNNKDKKYVIISAKMKLQKADVKEIEEIMEQNANSRKEKQPLEYPSAGSTFKRPEGYFVGKLIDEAGLKGKRIGGAEISNKHSGFIVNVDNATAKDVLELIELTKKEIYNKFNVKLEEEIIIIGDGRQ